MLQPSSPPPWQATEQTASLPFYSKKILTVAPWTIYIFSGAKIFISEWFKMDNSSLTYFQIITIIIYGNDNNAKMLIWEWTKMNFSAHTYFHSSNQDRAQEEEEEKSQHITHFNFSQCVKFGIHNSTPLPTSPY